MMLNHNNTDTSSFDICTNGDDDDFKKRKQRKIYNAYTDIDSVNEPPGPGFRNWIITTKKKLRVKTKKKKIKNIYISV